MGLWWPTSRSCFLLKNDVICLTSDTNPFFSLALPVLKCADLCSLFLTPPPPPCWPLFTARPLPRVRVRMCIPCRRGGVLLTTYGMVLHNAAQLRAGLGSAVARGESEGLCVAEAGAGAGKRGHA